MTTLGTHTHPLPQGLEQKDQKKNEDGMREALDSDKDLKFK